jgi:DhnA family fructose-bisphosphate aldolase class Ia
MYIDIYIYTYMYIYIYVLGAFDTKDISDMDADTVSSPIDIGVRSSSNDLSMIGQTTDTAARIGILYMCVFIYIHMYIDICVYV